MPTLHFLCLLVALVLFIIAALGVNTQKYSLTAAGLAFVTLALLIP